MTTTSGVAQDGGQATETALTVVICTDSLNSLAGIQPEDLAESVSALAGRTVTVSAVKSLCETPASIKSVFDGDGRKPLVIGACRGEYSRSDLLRHAKKAGGHPLSVQIVELKGRRFPSSDSPELRVEGAVVALSAAGARAAVAPDPRGINMKPVLISGDGRISRRSLFTLPPIEYVGVPSIDRSQCAATDGCQVCVSNCPHDALTAIEDFINIDRKACLSCGICVSACPQRAIDLPGNSVQELESQNDVMADAKSGAPIVYSCSKSQLPPADGWQVINVACAGMVPVGAMIASLNGGASAVAVRQCTSVCTQNAGQAVAGRVDFVRDLLKTTGDDPGKALLLKPADEDSQEAAPDSAIIESDDGRLQAGIFGVDATWTQLNHFVAQRSPEVHSTMAHSYAPTGIVQFDRDTCTTCGTCSIACPTGAISEEDSGTAVAMTFNPARCVGCGECVNSCPEIESGAITMTRAFNTGSESHDGMAGFASVEVESVKCTSCGNAFTTVAVLERLQQILGDDYSDRLMGQLCSDCRGLAV